MSELHGVETLEHVSGAVAVTTVATAVIGLVGTAPLAPSAVASSGEAGSVLLNSRLVFTAAQPGREGNALSVVATLAPEAGSEVAAQWDSEKGELMLLLAVDDAGAVISTATDVVAAVAAVSDSGIRAELAGGVDGGGVVSPFTLALTGGEDEPFPLNTPVVVTKGRGSATQLGCEGTLLDDLNAIFDQFGALAVVSRAESADTPEAQRAAILAALAGLQQAKSVTTFQPRILIAPEFSSDDAIASALETLAHTLRAVTYIDSAAMATAQEVAVRRALFGERVELLRPRVQVTGDDGVLRYRPYSAFAAGLRARIDNEKGWWWSKSNQTVLNITGIEQPDDWSLSNPNSTANLLNMDNISTLIRNDGFKHWGNRLCGVHPQLRFESVRRTADVIEDSIQEAMLPYLDRPLDKYVRDDILDTINSFLRRLTAQGAIFGGRAWLNAELNTAESLAAGWLWIDYDFGPKSPLERLTLTANPTNNTYALKQMEAA